MVAKNPLFAGWSLKKFKATVVNDIWPEVLFFSGVATREFFVSSFPRHLSPKTLCARLASGDACIRVHRVQVVVLQRDAHRARYGARSGYFLQDINGIREVRAHNTLAQCTG